MRIKIIFLIISMLSSYPFLFGQNLEETQIFSTMDADVGDESGISVAISGDFALVGAWTEDDDVMGNNPFVDAGAAYIFERDATGTWTEVQKIVASDRATEDRFGKSVAIDGNHLVVGAHLKNIDANNIKVGAAYVFERDATGTWNEVAALVSSDRAEMDEFGTAVSIYGNTIVIGAPLEDQNTMNMDTKPGAGSVYIFKKDNTDTWIETQKIVALDRAEADLFGTDISIWDSTIIVGAHKDNLAVGQENAGSAYFFQQDINGDFIEVQKITASDIDANDSFGFSVAIFDTLAVIGAYFEDDDVMNNNTFPDAGSAYVFRKGATGFWNQDQKIVASDRDANDYFGYDVSISGNYILVGAPYEDHDELGNIFRQDAGSVYSFEKDLLGEWQETKKIVASDRINFDFFGFSVSISTDHAFVGAPVSDPPSIIDAGKTYLLFGECLNNLIITLDSLASRTYKSGSTTVTLDSVHVLPNSETIFQAGTSITLTEGFWAQEGSDFLAHIVPCILPQFNAPNDSEVVQNEKRESFSNNNLKIFPNPNNGSMSLQFNIVKEQFTKIDLFHSSGKLIKTIFSGKAIGNYNLELEEHLPTGIYYFRMADDTKQYIYKVVVLQN